VIVWALLLAALGFGLLVYALLAGSVLWAWACIAACVGGGVLLLVGALRRSKGPNSAAATVQRSSPTDRFPGSGPSRHRHRRPDTARSGPIARPSWDQGTDLIGPPAQNDFRPPDRMEDNWR
jgi:hypothetical protein